MNKGKNDKIGYRIGHDSLKIRAIVTLVNKFDEIKTCFPLIYILERKRSAYETWTKDNIWGRKKTVS